LAKISNLVLPEWVSLQWPKDASGAAYADGGVIMLLAAGRLRLSELSGPSIPRLTRKSAEA